MQLCAAWYFYINLLCISVVKVAVLEGCIFVQLTLKRVFVECVLDSQTSEMADHMEHKICMKFCFNFGKTVSEIYEMLKNTLCYDPMSKRRSLNDIHGLTL